MQFDLHLHPPRIEVAVNFHGLADLTAAIRELAAALKPAVVGIDVHPGVPTPNSPQKEEVSHVES